MGPYFDRCIKKQQVDAVEATIIGKNVFVSFPTVFGKSLVYQLLPVCAKELSSLISTDYHPFVVIFSRIRRFVVKIYSYGNLYLRRAQECGKTHPLSERG